MQKEIKEENYQLTIYKFIQPHDLQKLSKTLSEKIIGNKEIKNNNVITIDEKTKILYFSFLNKNKDNDIEWFKKWNKFFNLNNVLRASSSTGHGAIVVQLSDVNEQYLLIFGRSYSLFKEHVIPNYGISMAEKLFNGRTMDSVSSKYFSLTKNKSIISYTQGANYDFEEGEAAELLKATIDEHPERLGNRYIEDLLKYIKPLATISYSNIKITIAKKEIVLNDIIDVIRLLHNIEENYGSQFGIPQMKPAKKEVENKLNQKLLESIKAKDTSIVFSVPFFNKSSNDYYVFLDSIDSVILKYRRSSKEYQNFSINDLFSFVENNSGISSLDQIHCIIKTNQIEKEEPNITKWLEAQIDYDGITYALYYGKWHSFNDNYLQRLNQRIKEIENEGDTIILNNEFSIDAKSLNQFCNENEQEILNLYSPDGHYSLSQVYKEFKYNYFISRKKDWDLFDRCIFESVEICDLFAPEKSFIHCKIGKTENLEECLRQSMMGLTYFTQKQSSLKKMQNKEGKELTYPKKIVVLYLSESNVGSDYRISTLRSLKCKLTFINWYKQCVSKKLKPQIIIANYQKNDSCC